MDKWRHALFVNLKEANPAKPYAARNPVPISATTVPILVTSVPLLGVKMRPLYQPIATTVSKQLAFSELGYHNPPGRQIGHTGEVMEKQPALTEYPEFEHNPSIVSPESIMKRRAVQRGEVPIEILRNGYDGTEFDPGSFIFKTTELVDKQQFVKIFVEGMRQYSKLSKPGIAVFEHVALAMYEKRDIDYVDLTYSRIGMSKSAFNRGMRDLMAHRFLFRTPFPTKYWLNIQYAFNGDRLAFVKAYRLRSPIEALSSMPPEPEPEAAELEAHA